MTYEFYDPKDSDYQDQMKDFERSRINKLQQERVNVQKKTFTKWCNSFLNKHGMEINDLFRDLEDGKKLIKLLEIISGEKLGKPNQGKLKVHKIENVNKALSFIQSKVKLESIGAEDIVAGTPNLILGLIWTIILRFQIQDIEFIVEDESKEKRSAKEALLLWCQRKTAGYTGVKISDFSASWRNGLAFNALIHSQKPELFDYNSLKPNENIFNLNHAFDMALNHLGISCLLDAEDIDVDKPDEKSIITYVSQVYHTFAKMKTEAVGGKRVGKIIGFMIEIDRMIQFYEAQVDEMQNWIQKKISEHYNFEFPNSLDAIKSLMLTFNKGYMTIEKPPKYKQKVMLTAHFYNINMKLSAQGHPKYTPADGKTINDLETQWTRLEEAEHERNSALKKELDRLEKLEKLYAQFDTKAKLREDWLSEMAHILTSSPLLTTQIDATFRKQEAIGTDMQARAERFSRLDHLAKRLINEDYFFKETVRKRNQQIQQAYVNLLDQYEKRKSTLATFQELELLFQEMQSLKDQMLELETSFQSKEYGDYLLAVEDLLNKHALLESQKAGINQHLKSINRRAQQFTRPTQTESTSLGTSESRLVKEKLDALNKAFELINVLCSERRKYLEERRQLHKFIEEADDESMWLQEKLQTVKSTDPGHDLSSTQLLITKHEQLEDELKFRRPHIDKIILQSGEKLITAKIYSQKEVEKLKLKCANLKGMYDSLRDAAANRRALLEDSYSSQQYFADANEAESWMRDKMALVASVDSTEACRDEASAQALLQRHARVQEEIKAYEPEVRRLEEITNVLAGRRRFSSIPADMRQKFMKNQQKRAQQVNDNSEVSDEEDTLDEENLSSDTLDKSTDLSSYDDLDSTECEEVRETFTREFKVACVKALYPYTSKTFSLQRGEILELKEKSNEEWWLVEGQNGREGFAPANYLKEIGVQNIQKQCERVVRKQAATAAAAQLIKMDKQNKKKSNLRRKTTSIQPRQLLFLSTENLQKRQVDVNFMFSQLFNASIEKRKQLDTAITYYKWLRIHDELDKWIREKLANWSIDNKQENSLLENPDAAKRRYQAFNTDFLANQNEFTNLEKLSDDLKRSTVLPANLDQAQIQKQQVDINALWLKLIELKKYWDNSVKAIECIDKFKTTYADVSDLLNEKLSASRTADDLGDTQSDVKTVRALQARQDKLEREIVTIEANVNELRKTAEQVCRFFPQEKKNVQKKLDEINDLWFKLREDVKTRKAKLDEKHGLQRFENEVNDFNQLCGKIRSNLNELEKPHDLKQCEEMQKKFNDLEQEFNNQVTFKFAELKKMSQKQLAKRGVIGSVEKINSQLSQVANEKSSLVVLIDDKRKYLDDHHKYVKFKEDAKKFELLMLDQEAYLHYEDLGASLTDVNALQKRHDEFVAKLTAQDEKMKSLSDQFTKLTMIGSNKHFAAQEIEQILRDLTKKRENLKEKALERKLKLKKSKEFYEFKDQCDDLNSWLRERKRKVAVINNLDPANETSALIEKYTNKNEALEKELNANRKRLESLKADSVNLAKSEAKVRDLIQEVEANWLGLEQDTKERSQVLAETKYKSNLSSSLNDIDSRMKNLEHSLKANYNLNDLRSVKEALKKNNDLKKQISVELDLVSDLLKSDKLANLSEQSLDQVIKEYANKFNALNPLIEDKQKELELHLNLQQLIFDVDEEAKWMEQSRRQIEIMFASMPHSLSEALSLTKRQADLERSLNNHKPVIEKLGEQSEALLCVIQNEELKAKVKKIQSEWNELTRLNETKKIALNESLVEQEKLDEIAQITSGLAEKLPIISRIQSEVADLRDDSAVNKNAVKLSQLETDLAAYKKVLKQIEQPSALIECKLNETLAQLSEMQQQIEETKAKLELKKLAIEFDREASDLIQWLNEKRQKAQSEEYGQDYEHLIQIQAKFTALKDEIKVFEEPRLERIRKLSTALLNAKSADSKQIRKRCDEIKVLHDVLEQDLQNRDMILNSAAEIHCFNKDVQDLLRRISDKELAFSNDLGRDYQSCESLRRKHEIFIEELTALKVQLQDINKQSELLRQRHPGDTAESVAAETDELIDQFRSLWLKNEKRTKELKQSSDYFKFIALVRDVNEWMDQTEKSIMSQMQLNDLFAVTQQRQEHDNLSYEMSQRDDIFKELDEMCIQLTKQNHPGKRSILELTNKSMTSRENLFRLWKLKSEILDAQYECHVFYRECSQLVAILNGEETILNNALNDSIGQLNEKLILSVDDLENQLKMHRNLEKKIEKQTNDKGVELEKLGQQLIEREVKRLETEDEFKINELARLEQSLALLLKKQNDVNELCHKRVRQLSEMIRFFKWCRDTDEFELWIEERTRFARSLNLNTNNNNVLSDKVKLFHKQKALASEIETQSGRFGDLIERSKERLESKPTNELRLKLVSNLRLKWSELNVECSERAKEFEEAKDVLEFNDQLEQIDEWLKEKELMLQNGDIGRDFEHCAHLIKRADEAIAPLNEEKLKQVVVMGDKLVSLGRTDHDLVLDKKDRLIKRYENVRSGVNVYRQKLNTALEMHSLVRDYDDLKQRISEKILLLSADASELRTLDAVQLAQTKAVDLESDTKAIRHKLVKLNRETRNDVENFDLNGKMKSTEAELVSLEEALKSRKKNLDSLYSYQKFMLEYRELNAWISDIMNRIAQQGEPQTLSEAETALNLHQERRTEIDGKTHRFIAIQQMARELTDSDVQRLIKEMSDTQQNLELKCQQQVRFLEECFAYQEVRESWKQLDNWHKQIESQLRSTDIGDSVLVVKSLLTKHENVESSVRSQMAPGAAFDSIEQRALEMLKNKSIHGEQIKKLIIEDLQQKRKELDNLCVSRRKNLDDSLLFHDFLLNYYEAIQWCREKTVIAIDKSYLDLTNLLTKIQRHIAFMSDLKKSGQKRVEDLHAEAATLVSRHQSTALSLSVDSPKKIAEIEEYVRDLDAQWNALKTAAEAKKKCLDDAHKFVLFSRLCNDILNWCDEVEQQLSSDDNGHDLSSCKMLLLRHEGLARDLASQEEKVKEIDTIIFNNLENFMFGKMKEQADLVKRTFHSLNEPILIRKENLEESLCMFTILHDLDDSCRFVQEKWPLVFVEDLGASLDETLKLNRKHLQLEQELQAHAPLIQVTLKSTKQLIDRKHYAHTQLTSKLVELEQKWKVLKQQAELRSSKLRDAVEVQKYFAGVDDLVVWLNEKKPELMSTDYGDDDLAALSCLKKLEALTNDLKTNQQSKLTLLVQQSLQLQLLMHDSADKKNIARKQADLEALFNSLCEAGNEREQHIRTMLKIFEFERECEANVNWIKDQQVVAASQDFGTDLEHAEALMTKFVEFQNDLFKNSDRVQRIDEMAQQLCENKYTPDVFIERLDEKCSSLNELWKTLNTLAEVRRQTLEGAIEVHSFDKDCDDLITWSAEKEAFLDQDEIGYELASVFTLSKQQEAMENEMTALKEELDRLNAESQRLCAQYPETREHIETRLEDADSAYAELVKQLLKRKEKIQQSQSLFILTSEFNELSEWLREMLIRITSADLNANALNTNSEVNNAEMLIKRHREVKIEIDMQQTKLQKFVLRAEELTRQTTTSQIKSDIKSKIEAINSANRNLLDTWQSRHDLYEQNLEYNKLYREIKLLDAWLSSKDSYVNTDLLGDNVNSVDALIKQHADFERMLNAMESRFENLKKENKLEKTLRELKQRELEHKKASDAQLEEEKKKEAERKRKLEKKRQDDRRRTQEIISIVSAPPTQSIKSMSSNDTLASRDESSEISSNRNSALIENHLPVIASGSSVGGASNALKARKDRNRTRSIRDKYKLPIRLPQPTAKDYLMRKQECQKGGQRAPIREYQSFFTTIHANLMCFFVNEKDYNELNAVSQPINLYKCSLNQIEDATLQRNVLHLETSDGAEYLFDAAGDENNLDNLELWRKSIIESSNTPPLPVLSISSTTSSSMTKTEEEKENELDSKLAPSSKMTIAESLDDVKVRLPRSRAPLLISLPSKIESIDIDEAEQANNDYLSLDASQNNTTTTTTTSNTAFINSTYLSYKNNIDNKATEVFQQDVSGQLNESNNNNNYNNEISIDTVDIAPYRYRHDAVKPSTPLLKTTVYSTTMIPDKDGQRESSSVTISRPPITIIKKGASSISPRSLNLAEEGHLKSPRKVVIQETSSEADLRKASLSGARELTQTKVIYAQSSSKTLGQIIPNEEYEASNINDNIVTMISPKSSETVSSSNEYNEYDDATYSAESNTNGTSNTNYGIANLVSAMNDKTQAFPTNSSLTSDQSSETSSLKEHKKHKSKNIFGSLFKSKKSKSGDSASSSSTITKKSKK